MSELGAQQIDGADLQIGLLAVLDEEKISIAKHKDLIIASFKAQGLDKYTWEGAR